MKNYSAISAAALVIAIATSIVASSNAAAIDFIYCLSPDGSVRAISTSYTSDCSGLSAPGSREINETRAKALFEEERMKALGLGTGAQAADEPRIMSQMPSDIQAAMTTDISWGAQAFDCSKHFAAAQTGIDKVAADMKADTPWKRMEDKVLVQALLDDAISRLASAKHNHEMAQNDYDHARDIAMAGAALGYARAADIFHLQVLAM